MSPLSPGGSRRPQCERKKPRTRPLAPRSQEEERKKQWPGRVSAVRVACLAPGAHPSDPGEGSVTGAWGQWPPQRMSCEGKGAFCRRSGPGKGGPTSTCFSRQEVSNLDRLDTTGGRGGEGVSVKSARHVQASENLDRPRVGLPPLCQAPGLPFLAA